MNVNIESLEKKQEVKQLITALLLIDNKKLMFSFLRDLLTEQEIEEFANRLEVAKLLKSGMPQRDVSAQTGVSIATVTRVNYWLTRGMNGYNQVLNLLNKPQKKKVSYRVSHI